ncbi:MAG TPA: type II toxin-antitoxin system Phd/YefM family antitoxin [bacterium]|jgi:prevent-host-death family protein|nr:type II toxin-antitoxin system Phd/YefM family antitoxin [bacterium]HPG36149.1 type II toxin-antitoxin system Phd/YefM family antitoxin [bacterium]HPV22078.1 type II toxin-antitoxin system Phd/YefM family antitoxin [bacterium]HRQ71005.1 type II toxin-antitoxin system Phd/YefM family antitoxin [bacterium]
MTIIRPVSDLRNNFNEISEVCHNGNEPVFITKNGVGDLVVMSMAGYEKLVAKLELYKKLLDSQAEAMLTTERAAHGVVMEKLRTKYNAKKTED